MPGETGPASTRFYVKSGCGSGESFPRSGRARCAQQTAGTLERFRYKLKREKALSLEWTRHAQGRSLVSGEAEPAVIGRVAHEDYRAMPATGGRGTCMR